MECPEVMTENTLWMSVLRFGGQSLEVMTENMLWMDLLIFGGQCLHIMTENTLWILSNDRKRIVEVCVKI